MYTSICSVAKSLLPRKQPRGARTDTRFRTLPTRAAEKSSQDVVITLIVASVTSVENVCVTFRRAKECQCGSTNGRPGASVATKSTTFHTKLRGPHTTRLIYADQDLMSQEASSEVCVGLPGNSEVLDQQCEGSGVRGTTVP